MRRIARVWRPLWCITIATHGKPDNSMPPGATVRERILAEPELFLKTQRQSWITKPSIAALERELEMAAATLRRAGKRLGEALQEIDGRQQEQAQEQIASARRELDRMT